MGPSRASAKLKPRRKDIKSKNAPKSAIRRFIVVREPSPLDGDNQSGTAPSSVKVNGRTSCMVCRLRKKRCELEAGVDRGCQYCIRKRYECSRGGYFESETTLPANWAKLGRHAPEVENGSLLGAYPDIRPSEENTSFPLIPRGIPVETGDLQEPSSAITPTSSEVFQPPRTSWPSLDTFQGDGLMAELLAAVSEPSHSGLSFPTGNVVHDDFAGLDLSRSFASQAPDDMQLPWMHDISPHLGIQDAYVAGEASEATTDLLSEWIDTCAAAAGDWA